MSLSSGTLGPGYEFINATDMPNRVLEGSREIASVVGQWLSTAQTPARRTGSLYERNTYSSPVNPILQMILARRAVQEDDVVSGAADATEGLIFSGAKWECEDPDVADVFNQISTDLNLDAVLRQAYRELFTCSQVVFATWWQVKTYQVRGYTVQSTPDVVDPRTGQLVDPAGSDLAPQIPGVFSPAGTAKAKKGPKRRKKFTALVPVQMTVLDSTKVIPVGSRLWGGDRLAWHGTAEEIQTWEGLYDGSIHQDLTMAQLISGKYVPDEAEARELSNLGIDPTRLLELNPQRVWRHTLTKPSYERWADVRLRAVFRLLDLKANLQEADRVNLIGAANYILLVKKGSKEEPAYQTEIDNLQDNFKVVARLPVIVSDHRLSIEIVTPKTDMTLVHDKYDVLDRRILARMIGALSIAGSGGGRSETSLTIGRMVGRLLESRRHMLKRAFEEKVARAVLDANPGVFASEPNLAFLPRQVQLDADPQITQAILALRQQKELSRDSTLEYFGFDETVEAQRRVYEDESGMDDIFGTQVPFSSPAMGGGPAAGGLPPGAQATRGAEGGRPSGGGRPAQNGSTTTGSGND